MAAGEGKRMRSARQKVLHEVCGRPSLWYVLRAALAVRPSVVAVVVHHGKEEVEEAVRSWGFSTPIRFVDQGTTGGTGHAVLAAKEAVTGCQEVLVFGADDPLITGADVRRLLRVHRRTRSMASLLVSSLRDPTGYGRIVRSGQELVDIVEEGDASPEVRAITEVAAWPWVFDTAPLFTYLPKVGRNNAQREQYLHRVLPFVREAGGRVSAVPADFGGVLGLNSRRQLADVTRVMRERILRGHMSNGVTFVDPNTAYVDVDVKIAPEAVIQPLTFLQGSTRIGAAAVVGPGTRVMDSVVGEGAEVAFSVVRGARIGPRVSVGPYASLRPGTVIEEGGKAGTFVEIKSSRVGKGSKVPHLSYVGDAVIGRDSNIGAGTVTVNYDGFAKHRTVIGDDVHIGSDTMLVAPVKIGKRAWTGAGSVISKDVPPGALAVERSDQRIVRGYDDRKRRARKQPRRGEDRG
jgi:bifunctional UDP-N-acetylglucosamine pyrophosphorylase/glucosamine-1-phosphate N-acetyltransferase